MCLLYIPNPASSQKGLCTLFCSRVPHSQCGHPAHMLGSGLGWLSALNMLSSIRYYALECVLFFLSLQENIKQPPKAYKCGLFFSSERHSGLSTRSLLFPKAPGWPRVHEPRGRARAPINILPACRRSVGTQCGQGTWANVKRHSRVRKVIWGWIAKLARPSTRRHDAVCDNAAEMALR